MWPNFNKVKQTAHKQLNQEALSQVQKVFFKKKKKKIVSCPTLTLAPKAGSGMLCVRFVIF